MSDVYSIAQWDRYYENNRSRIIKTLSWVPVPNSHDGENYSTLMARKDGPEIFAAWILLLQVASRCEPRGSLLRANGEPHTPATLSLKTRAPLPLFEKSLPVLTGFGWLSCKLVNGNDTALACHDSAAQVPSERQRIEGKGMEQKEELAPTLLARARNPLFDALAEACGSIPHQLTKRAASACGVALAEIRNVAPDLTVEEIRRRVTAYRQKFPRMTLTPSALCSQWAQLGNGTTEGVGRPAPIRPLMR